MNIEDYTAAVAWFRRNLAALQSEPDDPTLQYTLLHSFEVLHNISEAFLREAYVGLAVDEYAQNLSLRELIWRAADEGLVLSTRTHWLEYGLALESMRDAFSLSASGSIVGALQLLSRFADEVESFARCLERRLAHNA